MKTFARLGLVVAFALLLAACGGGGGGGGSGGPTLGTPNGIWDTSTWDNANWQV